jgi:hypothetical protein
VVSPAAALRAARVNAVLCALRCSCCHTAVVSARPLLTYRGAPATLKLYSMHRGRRRSQATDQHEHRRRVLRQDPLPGRICLRKCAGVAEAGNARASRTGAPECARCLGCLRSGRSLRPVPVWRGTEGGSQVARARCLPDRTVNCRDRQQLGCALSVPAPAAADALRACRAGISQVIQRDVELMLRWTQVINRSNSLVIAVGEVK